MPHKLKPTCILLLLLALSFNGSLLMAQSVKPPTSDKQSSAAPARSVAQKTASPKTLTPEQLNALAVMDGLFEAAKRFDDEAARIKTRAQIADVLWAYDEARARRELEESFRAVEKMKPAPKPQAANEPSMTAMMSEMFGFSPRIQLRSEVLRLVARHDAALAERLAKTIAEDAPDAKMKDSPFGNPGERSMLYLQMAMSLMETNPTRAAEFAKLSLQGGGINLLFPGALFGLRAKDQKLGDGLFSNALAAAQRDPAHALLNISMLAPYVFPDYGGGGASSMQMIGTLNPDFNMASLQTNPALVTPFLNFAYETILRQPEAKANEPDTTTAATSSDEQASEQDEEASVHAEQESVQSAAGAYQTTLAYAAGQQLMPYFERYAPEKAVTLRASLDNRLRTIPSGATHDMLDNLQHPATIQELTDKAEDAKTDAEKDMYYQQAATLAAGKRDYEQALSLIDKLHNAELQPLLGSVFRMQAAVAAIGKKDWDAAYRYGRDISDVAQRGAIFAILSQRLAEKKETVRATQILSEAELLIGKADNGADKARALLLIAGVAAHLDALRGFESLKTAVDAINNADAPAPEAKGAAAMVASVNNMLMGMLGVVALDFEQSVPLLARKDFSRTLGIAQMIRKKETSVTAQLAACRGVLTKAPEEKPKPAPRAVTTPKQTSTKQN